MTNNLIPMLGVVTAIRTDTPAGLFTIAVIM